MIIRRGKFGMESQKQKVIVVVTTEANQEVKDCLRLAASSLQAAAESMSVPNISTSSSSPSPVSQDEDMDSNNSNQTKNGEPSTAPAKRKRGRPKKAPSTPSTSDSLAPSSLSQNEDMDINQKRKRGRPSKKSEEQSVAPVKRKVGRPKKAPSTSDNQANKDSTQEKHDSDSTVEMNNDSNDVCPVCLEVPSLPVPLQCRHVYCFICAKGLAESDVLNGGSCAICRAPIPRDFFKSWKLSQIGDETKKDPIETRTNCWFYEGRQGWW